MNSASRYNLQLTVQVSCEINNSLLKVHCNVIVLLLGYGHSTPKTYGGKLFTMVYAMIGIPLGLVMFNSIGERLNNFSSIVINKLRKTLKAKQEETTEMDLIIVVSTLSAIVTTAGAAAFSHYEGNDFCSMKIKISDARM